MTGGLAVVAVRVVRATSRIIWEVRRGCMGKQQQR
jgi:hypothetical protein